MKSYFGLLFSLWALPLFSMNDQSLSEIVIYQPKTLKESSMDAVVRGLEKKSIRPKQAKTLYEDVQAELIQYTLKIDAQHPNLFGEISKYTTYQLPTKKIDTLSDITLLPKSNRAENENLKAYINENGVVIVQRNDATEKLSIRADDVYIAPNNLIFTTNYKLGMASCWLADGTQIFGNNPQVPYSTISFSNDFKYVVRKPKNENKTMHLTDISRIHELFDYYAKNNNTQLILSLGQHLHCRPRIFNAIKNKANMAVRKNKEEKAPNKRKRSKNNNKTAKKQKK